MTKKFENRGGARSRKRLYLSQSRLLQVLWNKHEGVTKCAEKIGVSRQLLINWKLDGRVPLDWCGKVSRAIGADPIALNYEGTIDFNSLEDAPSWKSVVQDTIKETDLVEYTLNGVHPDKAKEILKCDG
jgi:hypothetical protein